jgi:hypothetical protein
VYPAEEFPVFPLNWNSTESFRSLQEISNNSKLPQLPLTKNISYNEMDLKNMYLVFIDMLYQLPGANGGKLEKLKLMVMSQIRNLISLRCGN